MTNEAATTQPPPSTATIPFKRRVLRRVRRWAVILTVTYLIACLVLYSFQNQIIFPGAASQGTPDAVVEPFAHAELVHLTTASGQKTVALYGKALTRTGAIDPFAFEKPTALYFYGNGMNLSVALAEFSMMRQAGANCIAVEYLGYGMAEGKPSEQGCYAAAEAAYQYLLTRTDIDHKKLIPAGWSLGGAVAIDLAHKHRNDGTIAGLATFCTFTSMPDMARYHYPMFPAGAILQHRFDSEKKLAAIHVPYLLAHGRRDTLIPFSHADRLAAASKSPQLTRFTSARAGHNDFFDVAQTELEPVLKQWLRQF